MITDGLEVNLIEPATGQPVAPFFDLVRDGFNAADSSHSGEVAELSELSEQLQRLLDSDEVRRRTDDDTTVLAIHCS